MDHSVIDPGYGQESSFSFSAAGHLDVERQLLQAVEDALCGAQPVRKGCGLCDWQLKRVVRYVDRHIGSPIRVRELAAIAKLSQNYFARAFVVSVGVTPHTYLIERRMDRARRLMLASAQQLGDIAFECGLADQSHFSRLFRRDMGKTPSQWRRESLAHVEDAAHSGE